MPIELIPNQPYIFEQALPDQPCLNNDERAYAQLVTSGDTICIQEIITPCNEDELCDADMYEITNFPSVVWDVADGWSSADADHVSYDGASAGASDNCSQYFGTLVVGAPYRIVFEITSITGDAGVFLTLGLSADSRTFDALGTYTSYHVAQTADDLIAFAFSNASPTAGDTIAITIISIDQMTEDCWAVDMFFGYPSFSYSYDETTGQGSFCAVSDGALNNTSAFTTTGNYHRVRFTITNMTQGHVEIILGGVYLGSIYENGEYNLYGVPTTGTDLIFQSWDSFDGCISLVSVDDFGLLDNTAPADSNYQLTVINTQQTQESSILPFEVWDDRIIWCFNTAILSEETSPIEMNCDDYYQFKIVSSGDCMSDDLISTTKFRFGTWDCSFIVSGYSDSYAFGFYFGSVTNPLFYLTQRLRVLQFAPKYPAIGEEYLFSNGSFARSFAQSGKIRTAWFDYVDEPTHDVIRLQLLSDVLTVDSDVYFAPLKDYEPEWDEHRYNLAQSRVDLVKDETLFNRSCSYVAESPCTTNVVTTPPSTTIAYRMTGTFDLTDVTDSNFDLEWYIQGSFGTNSGNDATTLAGRNAIIAYMNGYITTFLGGSIINQNIIYVAPILDITVVATGNYNSTYSSACFTVDLASHPTNVIMLQPA